MTVIDALNKVMDEIGRKQPDENYINSPLWDKVITTAQYAFTVLMEKKTITEEYKKHWNALRVAFCKKPLSLEDLGNKWNNVLKLSNGTINRGEIHGTW